jgi:hypothetical protein
MVKETIKKHKTQGKQAGYYKENNVGRYKRRIQLALWMSKIRSKSDNIVVIGYCFEHAFWKQQEPYESSRRSRFMVV